MATSLIEAPGGVGVSDRMAWACVWLIGALGALIVGTATRDIGLFVVSVLWGSYAIWLRPTI